MAWQDVSLPIFRAIINDFGSTPTYGETKLLSLLVVSAHFVNQEVSFSTSYTIDVVNCSIAPEPDEPFINLIILKAACILGRGDQRVGTDQGYMIKDGVSQIDGRHVAEEKRKMADNFCKEYEDAVLQFRLGNAKPGKAVFGPINTNVTPTFIDGGRFN